jgi:hypothetical protein
MAFDLFGSIQTTKMRSVFARRMVRPVPLVSVRYLSQMAIKQRPPHVRLGARR